MNTFNEDDIPMSVLIANRREQLKEASEVAGRRVVSIFPANEVVYTEVQYRLTINRKTGVRKSVKLTLFNNDIWLHIKEFMGFIDFSFTNIQTPDDYIMCGMNISTQLTYYIKQIPLKTYTRYCFNNGLYYNQTEEFTRIIRSFCSQGVDSKRLFMSYNCLAEERYRFVSMALRNFKNCRMKKVEYKYVTERPALCPTGLEEFIKNRSLLKKNEGFLRQKYCQ